MIQQAENEILQHYYWTSGTLRNTIWILLQSSAHFDVVEEMFTLYAVSELYSHCHPIVDDHNYISIYSLLPYKAYYPKALAEDIANNYTMMETTCRLIIIKIKTYIETCETVTIIDERCVEGTSDKKC